MICSYNSTISDYNALMNNVSSCSIICHGRYQKMEVCKTPILEVTSKSEVAGGELKKFPTRLFAAPARIAKDVIPGVAVESYQEDNKLWKKRVNNYKRI